jgi:hypothetical protein
VVFERHELSSVNAVQLVIGRDMPTAVALLGQSNRFERLLSIMPPEPRVRAIVGAIGKGLGKPRAVLDRLRASLNPLSRFDFGVLSALKHAKPWQAKERRST